jgi:hypothetical protein
MLIMGCDYHPRFQQIAMLDTEGGDSAQLRLEHIQEAEEYYRSVAGRHP